MCQIYSRKGHFNCPLDCEGLWFMWRWRYLNILSSITRVWHSASAPASPWISHTAMTGIHGILESNICPDLTIQTSNLPIRHMILHIAIWGFLLHAFRTISTSDSLFSSGSTSASRTRYAPTTLQRRPITPWSSTPSPSCLEGSTAPRYFLQNPSSMRPSSSHLRVQFCVFVRCETYIYFPVLALAAYLYTLLQNDDLYMEYFQWRKYYNVFR